MTQTFKFLLGLFVIAFIVAFIFTIILFFSGGVVPTVLKWADFLSFGLAILCFPAITLSEAKRTTDENKKWAKENKHWKNDKEK